jgi:hypothetical protein
VQDETTEEPPLKQAISAMRSALDAAIGEELDRLLAGPSQSVPGGDAREDSGRAREPVSRWTLPLRDSVELLNQTDSRPSNPAADPANHPKPSNSIEPGSSDSDDADAAGRRLDALALRLEGRLRKARDRDAYRPRSDDGSFPSPTDSAGEDGT